MTPAKQATKPRPWHAWDRGIGWEIHVGPDPGDDHRHCQCVNDEFRDTFDEADAKLIVDAVNGSRPSAPEGRGEG